MKNKEQDHKFKHKEGEWVRLRLLWLPFISVSMGYTDGRRHTVTVAPFGVITREWYSVKNWTNGEEHTFAAWRLVEDKQRKLEYKMIGDQNVPG